MSSYSRTVIPDRETGLLLVATDVGAIVDACRFGHRGIGFAGYHEADRLRAARRLRLGSYKASELARWIELGLEAPVPGPTELEQQIAGRISDLLVDEGWIDEADELTRRAVSISILEAGILTALRTEEAP